MSTNSTFQTALAAMPFFGGTAPSGNYGINTSGDVLVNRTNDGVDLNEIWQELIDAFAIVNRERLSIVDLLSFWTTATGEAVPQNVASPSFEEATELGVPKSVNAPADALLLGYRFRDFDLATRFTWRYLRDANADQVRATIDSIIAADNKLVTGTILRRLFSPAPQVNEFGHTCYGLWNGTDGLAPPVHLGRTFDASTTHYIASQASQIDSADLEDAFALITRKGYGTKETGSQLLVLANPDDGMHIQAFRAGAASRPSGPIAAYDFIPSVDAPPYLTEATIVGQPAPARFNGLPVLGSYGPAFLIESNFVPSGYVAVTATSGPNSQSNVIGVREHPNGAYQGLRQIPGVGPYPIVESFSQRSFGVGTRHRGAAVAVQVTPGSVYSAPPATAIPV